MSEGIRSYLDGFNKLRVLYPQLKDRTKGFKYHGFQDLVLKDGRQFVRQDTDIPRGRMKECFANASRLALDNPAYTYVEGFALGAFFPMHHAWVTEDGVHAIETTWERGEEYLGIAFNTEWLCKRMIETGVYGVFGDFLVVDWFKNGLPDGAVKDLDA